MNYLLLRFLIFMLPVQLWIQCVYGNCINSVDVHQKSKKQFAIGNNRFLAIIPHLSFNCNGRITSIRLSAKVSKAKKCMKYPYFQVWRPSNSLFVYHKVNEVQLESNKQVDKSNVALINLTSNETIEFLLGDIVGYYHPPKSCYWVMHTTTDEYMLYTFAESPPLDSVNISKANMEFNSSRPLIQLTVDVQCDNISVADGVNASCSSGRVGVGYEGDTCNFTCNTGYNLTGSAQGMCHSNGTWSGLTAPCFKATGSSSRKDNSSSNGNFATIPVVFGVIGGVFLLLIIGLLGFIIYFKCLQRKRTNSLQGSCKDINEHHTVYTEVTDAMYEIVDVEQTSCATYEYGECTSQEDKSIMKGIYEYATPSISCERISVIEEEQIYDIPYEDEDYCGPIYTEPPTEMKEIFENFEGKILCSKNIRPLKQLGSGEFGVVTLGLLSSEYGDMEVAIKTLNDDANEKNTLRFFQEAAIMCQFDHQNVIKLHGVIVDTPMMIVLEYMFRGDLYNFLNIMRPLNGERVHQKLALLLLKFCQEVAAGMVYLSGKKFVHRDLAARNILLNEKCTCKIADFGMSRDLIDHNYYITSGGKIPVKWTAPEALHYRKYSVQSDVWSYGCVLYEIWSLGHKPFEELSSFEALEEVDRGYRLPPPPGCSRSMYKVMIKCWNPDPRSRPQFGQITKLLAGNVLNWSDSDKLTYGEDGMKLGAPLESAANLYNDLQHLYM